MTEIIENFLIEIALFSFLGVLYYFYQKRKIVHYEENKIPLIMNFFLQSCLTEKKDIPETELDNLIEALDDYLKNDSIKPPIHMLKKYMLSPNCSTELRDIIDEGLKEIESEDDKK
jgi:hypothetical protein